MIELKNGVQIPESAVVQHIVADLDGFHASDTIKLVQYDDTLPVVAVQLTVNRQPYIPAETADLNYRMGKPSPDTHSIYNPCLGVDNDGVVYFSITHQCTTTNGSTTLTIEVSDSGIKNSAPIPVTIAKNPAPESAIESTDEFLTLQEILAEAQKWGQIVQSNASNIQTVVDNLTAIEAAPTAAQQAAASAQAAQQAAQEALGFRTFFSAVTPDANGNLDPSRPMTVGPAASLTIESAGDRIESVTALGFTQQAGTGDPSPTNVRVLTNGGLKLVKLVLTGAENWGAWFSTPGFFSTNLSAVPCVDKTSSLNAFASTYGRATRDAMRNLNIQETKGKIAASNLELILCDSTFSSAEALKADLAARYAAGDPVIVWYIPADESQSTGLYAPIPIQGGEYRATCLDLTAPLCEGDSVVSWVKSGCDVEVTFDGSEDENWSLSGQTKKGVLRAFITAPGAVSGSQLSNWLRKGTTTEWDVLTVDSFVSISASSNINVSIKTSETTIEAFRQILSANPLTVRYRSINYTEKNDIPVSMETHVQAVNVFDGTENWIYSSAGTVFYADNVCPGWTSQKITDAVCSQYKIAVYNTGNNTACGPQGTSNTGRCHIRDERFSDAGAFAENLAAQYAAGTPVTIVYQLSTPITYAHPAVIIEAATGDQLTYTVTGQTGGQVSVTFKPFQDGGHAKTADNATNAATADNATNAATADNAQKLGGLTLSALQNLIAPIGYTFEWAPVSGSPDLSTAQKVADYFGFGTWQAYGSGQVLVGVDSGQTEFATVGQTGGEKTHTLTAEEGPPHQHETNISDSTGENYLPLAGNAAANVSNQITTRLAGGGQPHNNLQPYVVVYRWQRIA